MRLNGDRSCDWTTAIDVIAWLSVTLRHSAHDVHFDSWYHSYANLSWELPNTQQPYRKMSRMPVLYSFSLVKMEILDFQI